MCIETDDEIIYFPPNRQLIAKVGQLAKAEQQRLEREYGLQDGRRPRKRTPGKNHRYRIGRVQRGILRAFIVAPEWTTRELMEWTHTMPLHRGRALAP
jgi:hypothetical protein